MQFTALHRLLAAALVSGALAASPAADGRIPGSVLVYPVQYSGGGKFTLINVTNTNTLPSNPFSLGGTTNVHFEFVNVTKSAQAPLLPTDCTVTNRTQLLTPTDTFSILSSCINPGVSNAGYLVVTAEDPNAFDRPWSHDFLVGSELVIDGAGCVYSLNAIPFDSPQPQGSPTDVDLDGQLDFDGLEYEALPDQLYLDVFLAAGSPALTLINMTGGTAFTAVVDFTVFNDNEFALSATVTFRCWFEQRLDLLSVVFDHGFLQNNTPNDPTEVDFDCTGSGQFETGWARIDGLTASSNVESIPDPAFLGAITSRKRPGFQLDGGHLLFESYALQGNGDFLKTGADDPEH